MGSIISIIPFLPSGVFDDAATKAMGEAFDAACKMLYDAPAQPEKVVQEALARRIVAAARKGERNVTRLRDAALTGLAGRSRAAADE